VCPFVCPHSAQIILETGGNDTLSDTHHYPSKTCQHIHNLKLRAKYGHFTRGETSGKGNHGHFMPVFLKHVILRSRYKFYVTYVAHLLFHVSVHIILRIEGTKCPRSLWGLVLVPMCIRVIFNLRSKVIRGERKEEALSLSLSSALSFQFDQSIDRSIYHPL
jgi:hypothetical protein